MSSFYARERCLETYPCRHPVYENGKDIGNYQPTEVKEMYEARSIPIPDWLNVCLENEKEAKAKLAEWNAQLTEVHPVNCGCCYVSDDEL